MGIDTPVPADYDGDGKADLALFRNTTAQWLILQSTAGPRAQPFGGGNLDVPLPTPLAYRYRPGSFRGAGAAPVRLGTSDHEREHPGRPRRRSAPSAHPTIRSNAARGA